ncbi:hypothetical protein [Kluyvera georgiana]|uniref:hypothetical protein n=1 Tax=Kluyvera georgiana TaxID=73098 RepID=UPI001FD7DE64|nr:hypothetical protein [Kluyvera georgiana]
MKKLNRGYQLHGATSEVHFGKLENIMEIGEKPKSALLLELAGKLAKEAEHLTDDSHLQKEDVVHVLRLALMAEELALPALGFGELSS